MNDFKDNLYQSYSTVEEAGIAYVDFIKRSYKKLIQEIPMHQNIEVTNAHVNSNKDLVLGFILGCVVGIFFMSILMYYFVLIDCLKQI